MDPTTTKTKAPAQDPALEQDSTAAPPPAADETPPVEGFVVKQDEPNFLDILFETWIRERIHNSPLSRESVSYNYLLEVLPDLKSRILGGE